MSERKLKGIKSGGIELTLNDKQIALVNALIANGCYGNTANQVLVRLIDSKLIELFPTFPKRT